MVNNHVGEKLAYPSVIQASDEPQVLAWQRENWLAYGETASGHKVWTKFDPLGLTTGQEYVDDATDAVQTYKRTSQALAVQFKKNPNFNYREYLNDAMAARDNRLQADREGLGNLVEYAQWGEAHDYGHINPLFLDDDNNRTRSNRSAGGKLFDQIENTALLEQNTYAFNGAMSGSAAGMIIDGAITAIQARAALTESVGEVNNLQKTVEATPSAPATVSPAASDVDSAAMHTVDPAPVEEPVEPYAQQQVSQQQQANAGAGSGTKMVDISKLKPPATRLTADANKLLRHGPFDWRKYTPIIVEQDGDLMTIQDGMTRVQNAQDAGVTSLPAYVFPKR